MVLQGDVVALGSCYPQTCLLEKRILVHMALSDEYHSGLFLCPKAARRSPSDGLAGCTAGVVSTGCAQKRPEKRVWRRVWEKSLLPVAPGTVVTVTIAGRSFIVLYQD
jgi:hypothetical protein